MPAVPESPESRTEELLRIVLLILGGQVLVLSFVQHFFVSGSSVFASFYQGRDFMYFYDGVQAWLAGRNPYSVFGFVTPPLSLLIPMLLAKLPMDRAAEVFLWINLAVVSPALWWYTGALRLKLHERMWLLLCFAIFSSMQESIREGNLDSLMLALMIAAFSVRRRLSGALWLAASIGLKFYSVILIPVLLRRRQWRFALWTVLALPVLMLPFCRFWPAALHALLVRDARFLHRSISPPMFVYGVTGQLTPWGTRLCLVFWLVTFGLALYNDRERELGPATFARYVPWMLAWPALVFSYVGVLATAVLASLMATARARKLRPAEYVCLAGFLLLDIHVEQATNMMPLTFPVYLMFRDRAAMIQSLGVILMMLGTCLNPCGSRQGDLPDEGREETAFIGDYVPDRARQEVQA